VYKRQHVDQYLQINTQRVTLVKDIMVDVK